MSYKTIPATLLFVCLSCHANTPAPKEKIMPEIKNNENPYPFISSIPSPAGYQFIKNDSASFANWLLHIELKRDKTVFLYNGNRKANQSAQFAVLDISTGNKNLQQCADAVMRLRAEYLYEQKRFEEIIFKDNEGTSYQFNAPYNRAHFQQYLERVFGMCGSASLSRQLKHINLTEIKPGDVLIRGGFPGHVVTVINVAVNNKGKKIFMLAQSYMPAQDIHILINPENEKLSPWYEVNDEYNINTPEYIFTRNELKEW